MARVKSNIVWFPLYGAALLASQGCASISAFWTNVTGGPSAQQVEPQQFVQRRTLNEAPLSQVDRSGGLPANNPRISPSLTDASVVGVPAPVVPDRNSADIPAAPPQQISRVIQTGIKAPGDTTAGPAVPTTLPTTAPSSALTVAPTDAPTTVPSADQTPSVSLSSGQYLILGGVVAEVNGTPIFANKVLQLLAPTLHNDARDMDAGTFESVAKQRIGETERELIQNELEYAAAQNALDRNDVAIVEAVTRDYKSKLITQAGGSVEVARRQALSNGEDFDQKVFNEYKLNMIRFYYQKKFGSQLQVGAREMRQYYKQNLDSQFTERSEATFSLIGIDPRNFTADSAEQDKQMAFDKAKEAHDRAVAGQDFATLFSTYNNIDGLKSLTNGTGKWPDPVQKGAFSIPEVEDAIWKLQPGQVSDVIDVNGVLYIARLDGRKDGRVQPFDDEQVQSKIAGILQREQLQRLREAEQVKLENESIIREDQAMLTQTLNMAMQSYSVWHTKPS